MIITNVELSVLWVTLSLLWLSGPSPICSDFSRVQSALAGYGSSVPSYDVFNSTLHAMWL